MEFCDNEDTCDSFYSHNNGSLYETDVCIRKVLIAWYKYLYEKNIPFYS